MHRSRLHSWTVAAGLALACSTPYSWEASVALDRQLASSCLEAALLGQEDVFDVVAIGDGGFALRLEIPGVERTDAPSLAITQARDFDEMPTLAISTGYQTGWLEDADANRVLLRRAGELTVDLTQACTGQRVELGITRPCGRGEQTDLCVSGRTR